MVSLHSPGSSCRTEAGGIDLAWVLKSQQPPLPPPLLPHPSSCLPFSTKALPPSGGIPQVPSEQEAHGQDGVPFSDPSEHLPPPSTVLQGHTQLTRDGVTGLKNLPHGLNLGAQNMSGEPSQVTGRCPSLVHRMDRCPHPSMAPSQEESWPHSSSRKQTVRPGSYFLPETDWAARAH